MAREATQLNENANSDYSGYESSDRSNYQSSLDNYNSQISKMDAMGNPYESSDYLTNQNKLVSGAMHATSDAAQTQLQDAAQRTGTNSAALPATIASMQRTAQQTADTQQAQTATANEDKYLSWEQGLASDKLAATNSSASMYGSDVSGRSNALGNLQSGQNASEQMWGDMIGKAVSAGGAVGAAAV